jgi:hypothetical protein
MELEHGVVVLLGLRSMEKQRAWVQGGLGTSTTPHARRFMGSWETSRGQQQLTPLGPPASSGWPSSGGGPSARS